MSRVFRRPMFRGGSTNMNGIMSGIEDRKNYSIGTESHLLGIDTKKYMISMHNQLLIHLVNI
jgi:hypothetical protein